MQISKKLKNRLGIAALVLGPGLSLLVFRQISSSDTTQPGRQTITVNGNEYAQPRDNTPIYRATTPDNTSTQSPDSKNLMDWQDIFKKALVAAAIGAGVVASAFGGRGVIRYLTR